MGPLLRVTLDHEIIAKKLYSTLPSSSELESLAHIQLCINRMISD